MATEEIFFQKSSVHTVHDAKRLEEGEDLNDALLDFFVRLGQTLIPDEGKSPAVAYLGSLFYDVLRKGGVRDGAAGHANVAKWATRRLGRAGLFADSVGALAVPVNEMLRDDQGNEEGKHWWLALLLNPRGGMAPYSEDRPSLLCLDSFAHAEVECQPPILVRPAEGSTATGELGRLVRVGSCAVVQFRSRCGLEGVRKGEIGNPKASRLMVGDRVYVDPIVDLMIDTPRLLQGFLQFRLPSTERTSGEHVFEYGFATPSFFASRGAAQAEGRRPELEMRVDLKREATPFQSEVAHYLGGYVAKEWETSHAGERAEEWETSHAGERAEASITTPKAAMDLLLLDVPQQENETDCGFFILEQILRALQLPAATLRALASARDAESLVALPWPTQEEVSRRKVRLREALAALFDAADRLGTADVEALIREDAELREVVRNSLWEGSGFAEAARRSAEPWLQPTQAAVPPALTGGGSPPTPKVASKASAPRPGANLKVPRVVPPPAAARASFLQGEATSTVTSEWWWTGGTQAKRPRRVADPDASAPRVVPPGGIGGRAGRGVRNCLIVTPR